MLLITNKNNNTLGHIFFYIYLKIFNSIILYNMFNCFTLMNNRTYYLSIDDLK